MRRTIYSNYDLWETFPDSELTELAIINGMIEEGEKADDELLESLRYEEDSFAWDAAKEELTRFFDGKTVIFFGSCGTWRGNFAAGKVGEFWDLFGKAIKDCDYIELTDNNGGLFLECSHRDGTNNFEIKELTAAGKEYFDRWNYGTDARTEQDAHRQIIKRYSHRPHYIKAVWGI